MRACASSRTGGVLKRGPLGSWNTFRCDLSETLILEVADAMVASGLRDAGYTYVNVDDCWMLHERDAAGHLVVDKAKFPRGMKALGDELHARGLLFGIYSAVRSPARRRATGTPPRNGHAPEAWVRCSFAGRAPPELFGGARRPATRRARAMPPASATKKPTPRTLRRGVWTTSSTTSATAPAATRATRTRA